MDTENRGFIIGSQKPEIAYDPADNSAKCYALAIRAIRLDKIRSGLLQPRPDDAEEVAAAASAPVVVFPAAHGTSKKQTAITPAKARGMQRP